MPRINSAITCLLSLLLLQSCSQKRLQVTGHAIQDSAMIQQQLLITKDDKEWLWVCYSEIENHQIIGFSCQNDTAMPLFSGGSVNGTFEFEYISKFLLKIYPERVLEYIKISIYPPGSLTKNNNINRFVISRKKQHTDITDRKKKLSVRLTRI